MKSLLLLSIILSATQARELTKCELIQDLKNHGMDKYEDFHLNEMICVTFHSSGFNTQIKVSNNGNTEYGIFQISNNGWCAEKQEDVAKSTCGILCSKLLDDDINDDIVCAKKIIEQPKGIDYWYRNFIQFLRLRQRPGEGAAGQGPQAESPRDLGRLPKTGEVPKPQGQRE
ncbi:alpha-lactalbumin [Monodelphis domestica]|uniref:alpha-lactalbumin n=1 Tax=Monodelphis domestica TaxID=13616 RepID=UPI0024E1E426|nr:alpha-lactalbumin [Monodelphis domestica]